MKLSIIIPVFNERRTIIQALRQVFEEALALNYDKEIIVIDDGSNDGSFEILKNLQKKRHFVLLRHPKNLGKGAALQAGFKRANGDLILIHDADLEYNPQDWQDLLKAFNNFQVHAVYGSRNLQPKFRGYFHYALGTQFLTNLVNMLFKVKLTDVYTGTKIFRSEVIKNLDLKSNNFNIEVEMTLRLLKQGLKIVELPISYYPRTRKQGKKIKIKDGISGLFFILKFALKKINKLFTIILCFG